MDRKLFLLIPVIALIPVGQHPAWAQDYLVDLSMSQLWADTGSNTHQGSGFIEVTDASGEPVAGAIVVVESSDPAVVELSPLQVQLSGDGTGSFAVYKHLDQASNCSNVTVSATYSGTTAQEPTMVCPANIGSISIEPPAPSISSMTLNPNSVIGGTTVQGTVTMEGVTSPITIDFSSDPEGMNFSPTSLNVTSSGSAGFSVQTPLVGSETVVIVAAEGAGDGRKVRLMLEPIAFKSLTLKPQAVTAGQTTLARLTLSSPAPKSITVSLEADPGSLVQMPSSITFNPGDIEQQFKVAVSQRTGRATSVTLKATLPFAQGAPATATAILELQ